MTRNPISEVARFFETNHNGKYRIYNLCVEQYACYRPDAFASGSVLAPPLKATCVFFIFTPVRCN